MVKNTRAVDRIPTVVRQSPAGVHSGLWVLTAIATALLLVPAESLPARTRLFDTPPETVDVRAGYLNTALAPLWQLGEIGPRIEVSRVSGRAVMVRTDDNPGYRYLLFVPELDGEYPVYSAGTYILRRRKSDGGIDQLKIFLRSDPGFFLRIRPDDVPEGGRGEQSTMSVHLAGVEVNRSIRLPVSLEVLLTEPLERILELSAARVDWPTVYPRTARPEYRDVAIMARRSRASLHTLPDAEDGAMDEHGNLVLIDSLVLQDQQGGFNCSGFAKWIVDGLNMALYGSFLPIEPLKKKHLDLRGHRWSEPQEDERDPYFGLDWTRNLATAVLSAEKGGREVHPEEADVRRVAYHRYVEDIGYPVARLPLIMYLLAINEPGAFYIGSVNREFGSNPSLNQHVHVVVFFPYFDEYGRFFVDVMERNVETSLASLDRRYHNDYIHLVRVRADDSYVPPVIRN